MGALREGNIDGANPHSQQTLRAFRGGRPRSICIAALSSPLYLERTDFEFADRSSDRIQTQWTQRRRVRGPQWLVVECCPAKVQTAVSKAQADGETTGGKLTPGSAAAGIF